MLQPPAGVKMPVEVGTYAGKGIQGYSLCSWTFDIVYDVNAANGSYTGKKTRDVPRCTWVRFISKDCKLLLYCVYSFCHQFIHLQAIQYYNEALRHCDSHAKSMLALAKLHLANGDMDDCQQQVQWLAAVYVAW